MRGRQPKYEKKTESYIISGFVMEILTAENENL